MSRREKPQPTTLFDEQTKALYGSVHRVSAPSSWVSRARSRGTSKLDDACVDRICDRIARGEFKKHACAAEGVSDETLRLLERDDAIIASAVAAAHAMGVEAKRKEARSIDAAPSATARWELERFDRDAFAPPKQQVESKVDASVQGSASYAVLMTVEQARALAAPKTEPEDDE